MSVWVTAMFGHKWPAFSRSAIERIAGTLSRENTAPRWLKHPGLESPEAEFAAEGNVSFFLPANFTIEFGRRLLNLQHTDRWSTFLVSETVRNQFLSACKSVAQLAEATGILLLPEGTTLMDQF